ncbi:AAA family ATPase [Aquimarina hainanensis]|uniref:AAA family ATPase n=1 Tax=Aquimarina hainanensis TaxID=1578017 RepID=A0ABW5NA73_9FLAO
MKIIIFGASGSGTTTLGRELAKVLSCPHLDVDDYYWKKTVPPFQLKIPLKERNLALWKDYSLHPSVVLSGSLVSWGPEWEHAFELAVFLYIPPGIRLERLRKREELRYGTSLNTDIAIRKNSSDFLNWAAQYDDPNFEGRSISIHHQWIQKLSCPVLKIEGDTTRKDRLHSTLEQIHILKNKKKPLE